MDRELVAKVIEEVEGEESEVVDLTSKLIQFETVSPPSDTRECAEYVRSYLEEAGLETSTYRRRGNKVNVRGRLRGRADETIIWLGHLDVVPPGEPENWSYGPFSGEVADGRVYGRGSTDMKGSCAAAMVAAKVLSNMDEYDGPTIDFWFTCDEEVGSLDGTRWLAESGVIEGDRCVIGDSFGSTPDKPWIDVGCRSYIRIRLTAHGRTAHGSVPFMGENAIERLIAAISEVMKVGERPLKLPRELNQTLESSTRFLLEDPGLNEKQREEASKLFYHPSVSLTMIKGGVKVNVIPDLAEAMFDIRVTPGVDVEGVKEAIRVSLSKMDMAGLEMEVTEVGEGYYEPPTSRVVEGMVRAVELVTGRRPRLKIMAATTDGIHIKNILGIPCVGFGAGVRGKAHTPDEYVTIENLTLTAKVYAVYPLIQGQLEYSQ